jgi:hypothetical protein
MIRRHRSKLDLTSMAFLVVGFVLFLIAAACYTVTAIYLLVEPGAPIPVLSLTEFGNIAGVSGMLVIPLFIVTAAIQNFRINRRNKRLENDIGDNPEPGAAERSQPD